jgi:hypothetical protein
MTTKPITNALSLTFDCGFGLWLGAFLGIIAISLGVPKSQFFDALVFALLVILIVAGPVWIISLGMIAHRLGRRWLVWVGLSIITSPFGPLFIYLVMRGHINAARKSMPAAP